MSFYIIEGAICPRYIPTFKFETLELFNSKLIQLDGDNSKRKIWVEAANSIITFIKNYHICSRPA